MWGSGRLLAKARAPLPPAPLHPLAILHPLPPASPASPHAVTAHTPPCPTPHPRALLRRHPEFPDVRAALAAALWGAGLEAEAETEWQRVSDPRYGDLDWVANRRRWPPRLLADLEALLAIRGVAAGA